MDIVACVSVADRLAAGAVAAIARARSAAEVAAAMASVAEGIEFQLALHHDGRSPVACGPGCHACCVVNVSVLIPESIAIADYLRQELPADDLRLLEERLWDFAQRVRWMDDTERPRHRLSCPFLDLRGHCLIHPVRPLLCRSISSLDPSSCEEAVAGAGESVIMDLPQKVLCSLTFSAMGTALQDFGLDSRSLELTRMVACILRNPELESDFLAQKRPRFP